METLLPTQTRRLTPQFQAREQMTATLTQSLFISYDSRDSGIAGKLGDGLRRCGFDVWNYQKKSLPGVSYLTQTGDAIRQSLAVLVLLSKASCASRQVKIEVVRAHEENKLIFPVLIDISHSEFRSIQPELREALGASVSISVDDYKPMELCRLIAKSISIVRAGSEQAEVHQSDLSTGSSPEAPLFSSPLCRSFGLLNQKIESLTVEQFRVLNMLKRCKRARISGCAGSGKTLVAAEKSLRLDGVGLRVLFLCQSPVLAKHAAAILHDTHVDVLDFASWISRYAPGDVEEPRSHWDYDHSPSSSQIDEAFDRIHTSERKFDAIIVDEAQDFRPEWWLLVEAALADAGQSFLYLFHDDKQQLSKGYLPHYPVDEPHIDLSRNIRNAGNVFKVVKYYHRDAPPIEQELSGLGNSVAIDLPIKSVEVGLQVALGYVAKVYPQLNRVMVIVPRDEHESGVWSFNRNRTDIYGIWQDTVYRQLLRALRITFAENRPELHVWRSRLWEMCLTLSPKMHPSGDDAQIVNRFVKIVGAERKAPRGYNWGPREFKLDLRKKSGSTFAPEAVYGYFSRPSWHKDVPYVKLASYAAGAISMHSPGEAKGLEADVTIMVVRSENSYTDSEYYVSISRAKHGLFILSVGEERILPPGVRENLCTLKDYSEAWNPWWSDW